MRPIAFIVALASLSFPVIAVAQCSPSGVASTVKICSPTSGATVNSPVSISAAATAPSGTNVTAMKAYIDNVSKASSTGGTLNASLTLTSGSHSLVINAWNNLGAVWKSQVVTFTVSGTVSCTPQAGVVTICSPAANSTVASPVSVSAVAGAPSGAQITAMKLYVDGQAKFTSNSGTLSTSVALGAGTHNFTVNAWNNLGAVYTSNLNSTVSGTQAVSVAVSPSSVTLQPSAPKQFTATVSGSTNTAVTWSVDGVVGGSAAAGTITSTGLYTAPTATGSHTVSATSQADTTKSASAAVTVSSGTGSCSPIAGAVTICSPAANATVGSPVSFSAVAGAPSGSTVTSMKLYVDGTSKATSTTSSLNASIALAAGAHNITVNAWNNLGAVFGSKETINVTSVAQPGVSISPLSATILINGSKKFTATVTGLSDTSVTWTVDGVAGGNSNTGTVDGTGLYTAPGVAGSHTVKATSNADNTKSAGASVTVVTSIAKLNGVYTYMYNNGRTGLNASETKLTHAAVQSGANFGFKSKVSFDGTVQAQPLFAPNVSIGSGSKNVIYIATENDSVYALDEASPTTVLWKRNLIPSGATIGRSYSCSSTCDGRTGLGSNIGITGTPVIDPNSNRIYVVAKTTENSNQVYRLHALDLSTGADSVPSRILQGSATGIGQGSVNGTVAFNALTENQRPGLLLQDGIIYITFAAYSDDPPYHGWVLAYNAGDLSAIDSWMATPDTGGAGIWMAGAAPAADSEGNVYIATANQMPYNSGFPNIPKEIPNSIVKLKVVGSTLSLVDYFVPYNTKCLTNDDLDLGSSGPMLVPDAFNGINMMTVASKEGRIYLLDKNNLGTFHSGGDTQILDSVLFNPTACGTTGFQANYPRRVYGTTAYWNGNIYFGSVFGPLRQYRVSANSLQQVALSGHEFDPFASASTIGQSGRGPLTSVSSNGSTEGIVWTSEIDTSGAGWLRAFDANNVATQLYSVNFGAASHFTIPTVFNGKVYVTGKGTLYVYGTLR